MSICFLVLLYDSYVLDVDYKLFQPSAEGQHCCIFKNCFSPKLFIQVVKKKCKKVLNSLYKKINFLVLAGFPYMFQAFSVCHKEAKQTTQIQISLQVIFKVTYKN